MKFCEAVDQTFVEFKLTNREIAQKSGLTEAQLSEFRRGKREIHTDRLERLIAALPTQAQQFLFFNCLLPQMDDRAIGTLLYAISLKMRGAAPSLDLERISA
ncbi:helix-turn-helix domain-containing protein [Pantanalinema rosaneae CENA516]|uniref:helix-turn-helix domain-containing protein n=1 Tax=Pantanalinema rosaneae TaxID=1620701 RepID=UPI003D6E50A3